MIWNVLLVAGVLLVALTVAKRMGQVTAKQVRGLLKNGAVVVDVRSAGEFRGRHIAGAINLPLSHLREQAPRVLPRKDQPVLLYCLSGSRSMMARGHLKHLGYSQVYNLGSLARAENVLGK
jgi:rhodanese-related sulfurtransferase